MKAEVKDGIATTVAKSPKEWRKWLEKNSEKEKSVWLIIYKKDSGVPSITYKEAVEEALCFGWIDSKPNKRDEQSYYQFFAQRKPKSGWSKVNKLTIEGLISESRMHPTGLAAIERAKQNGTWTLLDEAHSLELPADLQKALRKNKEALVYFNAFPPSVKRGILEWIGSAKTEATRNKRIEETATLAGKNIRANQYTNKRNT